MARKKKTESVNESLQSIVGQIGIEETEAEAGISPIFSYSDQNGIQEEKTDIVEAPETKQAKQEKQKKLSFGFRADPDRIKVWKIYSKVSGMSMEDLGTAAMEEYISHHALDGTVRTAYELLLNAMKDSK